MKTQKHTLSQRLMAYILLFSLFLQNCTNPSLSLAPNKQEAVGDNRLQASVPIESSPQAKEAPTDLQEPIDQKDVFNQGLLSSLQGAQSTADQSDNSNTLSFPAEGNNLQPTHSVPSKSTPKLITNKPIVNSLQGYKRLAERQQVKSSSILIKASQSTKQVDKEVAATQVVTSSQASVVHNNPIVTKGRFQMTFEKTSEGTWKALVNESFQVGISRKVEMPVFFELGYNLSHVADSHWVHVIEEGIGSFIWIGSVGIKGGMYQQDDGDNNNRSNSNRNNSKAEVTSEVIPSDLSGKLKYLYQQDDTLPRLIEVKDKKIPVQSIQDYYVKLQVVLQESFDQGRSAAARDQVVGEKKPVEVDKLFDEMDKDHPAVSKVLLLGGPGIGKSTLMHYISYQWAQGKLWKDKYEHVFRVRLKDLLDPNWLTRYTREEREEDLLACFIDYCLYIQKSALAAKLTAEGNKQIKQIKGVVYKLDEIQQLLKDPTKKDKVLLLVDGYDEITSLKERDDYQHILDLGVFEHPQVIMTSRPNAASKDIRAKFERQVESQGLDEAGINQYINLQFKQEPALAQGLQAFLFSNSQIRSMCEVPINTALLCIIWNDPAIRAKFSNAKSMQADFKLGQLYHELIVWLGKRYAIKYPLDRHKPIALRELSDEAVLEEEVFKALERIAYQSFTGVGLEDPARQGGALGIPGQLVDQLARKEGKLKLSQLHEYGLLKGEGDPDEPLAQTYYFIHLTFQEYLTAHRLCKLLGQEDKMRVAEVATWIAHHRNEPKYLMTFKFLAGLVSQSKDERLVKRFWEAMSCNVDEVIELGVEGKVALFMHLLSQSKIGGQFDKRIPNIVQIAKLVDGTLQGDLIKWQQAIIEAGYFPTWLQQAASRGLEEGIGLARKASLDREARMQLEVAAKLLIKMVNQGVTLTFTREHLFDRFMELVKVKDWQVQKLGLEKAMEIVDKTIPIQKLEENAKYIVDLLVDANLKQEATSLLAKLSQIAQPVFKHLELLLKDQDEEVRYRAHDALKKLLKGLPPAQAWNLVKPLLKDKDKDVRASAVNSLEAIVEGFSREILQEAFALVKPLLKDKDKDVRASAAEALPDIVEGLSSEVLKEAFTLVQPLLKDKNEKVRKYAVNALSSIVKSLPSRVAKEAFTLLKPLLKDQDEMVQEYAVHALVSIVKSLPSTATKEAFILVKPLLKGKDKNATTGLQMSAGMALGSIVKELPLKEAFNLVKPLLEDKDKDIRSNAARALSEIVENKPSEVVQEALALVKSLLKNKDEKIRSNGYWALMMIMQAGGLRSGLVLQEAFTLLKSFLKDQAEDVRSSAAYALQDIIKDLPDESLQEAFTLVKIMLKDQNRLVREYGVDALGQIRKSLPSEEVFTLLKPLLKDENEWVRSKAASALGKVAQGKPVEFLQEAFALIKPLLKTQERWVLSQAGDGLGEILKGLPVEFLQEAFALVKPLLNTPDSWFMSGAAYALGKIVQGKSREIVQEALGLILPLLKDEYGMSFYITDTLQDIVQGLSFAEQVSLLADVNPAIRDAAKVVLATQLKFTAAIAKLDYQAVKSLLEIILSNKDQQEELAQALYKSAIQALTYIADHLSPEGLVWINNHFADLPTIPEAQTFLRSVIHHTLQDGMIDLQEAELLIKCIVERGLTVTINPQFHQITLEDNTHTLQPASQANLTHVVNEVIRLSKDAIAAQYRAHTPLFKNSGEGLPVATADIEKAGSILDKTALDSDSWHVSVLDLSGHGQSEPSKTFILLEQRNYAGQHVIHQLELYQEKAKLSFHAMNPLSVDEMKQKIFGELYLMKKPRCYAYSFTLSQKLGEQLIEAASQMKGVKDSYSVLHQLAGAYKAMQDNQEVKASDLFSLPWEAYSKNPAVKTYEKEELHGKAMGSGGVKVQVNIENLNAENIEDLQVRNIGNVNTRNIEDLKAKNVKNVNLEKLINT